MCAFDIFSPLHCHMFLCNSKTNQLQNIYSNIFGVKIYELFESPSTEQETSVVHIGVNAKSTASQVRCRSAQRINTSAPRYPTTGYSLVEI